MVELALVAPNLSVSAGHFATPAIDLKLTGGRGSSPPLERRASARGLGQSKHAL